MATNRRLLRHFLLIILFLNGAASLLHAQTAGYFFQMENGKPRFIQRLAWNGGEYALRYEVLIERQEEGRYVSYKQEFTTALFIDISLPPGEYRFRVTPYDILDRPGEETQWANIEVRHAYQPEISLPPNISFERGDDQLRVLEVDANNVVPGAEIYLRKQDGALIAPVYVSNAEDGSLLLYFGNDQLETGEYELVVKNPGGLEANTDTVVIEIKKPGRLKPLDAVIYDIGISFSPPVISLYGEAIREQPLYVSAAAHIGAGFRIPTGIHLGPEFTAVYQLDENSNQALDVGANLLIKKWMTGEKMAFNFRVGAEYKVFPTGEGISVENLKSVVGASVFWRLFKILYVEAGAEHLNLFVNNKPNGFLRFRLGLGVQF